MNESPEHETPELQSPELEDDLFVRTLLGQSQIEETPELLERLRRLRAARVLPPPEPSGELAVLLQGNVTGNVTPLAKRSRRRGIVLSFALASAMAAGTTGVAASNDGRISCDSYIDAGPFQQADPGEAPDDTPGEADEPAVDESDNSEPVGDDAGTQADGAGTQTDEPAEALPTGSDETDGPGGWSSPAGPAPEPEPEPEPGAPATGQDTGAGRSGEPGPAVPSSNPEPGPETVPAPAPDPAAETKNPEAPGHGGQGRGAGQQGPPHSGADGKPNGNGRGVPEGDRGNWNDNRGGQELRNGGPVDGYR